MKKRVRMFISIISAITMLFVFSINSFAAPNIYTQFSPVYQDFKTAENDMNYSTGAYSGFYTNSGSAAYYRLSVSQDGAYNIYSEGSTDVVGALYTKTGVHPFNWTAVLLEHDDEGMPGGRNFRIETDMDTNVSYWLAVRGYNVESGGYSFVYEGNRDETSFTTIPAHTTNGVYYPTMKVGATWNQDTDYAAINQYDVIAYYSAEELKYLYRFLEIAVMEDFINADSIDEVELLFEALGFATNLLPPGIIGTCVGFAVSAAGMLYNDLNEDQRKEFLGTLRNECVGSLGSDLLYTFQKDAKIAHYNTLLSEDVDISAYYSNTLYGVLYDRGTWSSNNYYD